MFAQKKDHMRTQGEGKQRKAKRERPQEKANLLTP